jgi:hypothetical protein
MGTVLDPLAFAHQVDEHRAAIALPDAPAVERRELAAAQGAAQKHRQNRPVPFSFHGLDLGLSEKVARLLRESQFPARFPDWRTPLRDTIPWATRRSSNPFSAASAASLRIADSRRLMEGGARRADSRALRYC